MRNFQFNHKMKYYLHTIFLSAIIVSAFSIKAQNSCSTSGTAVSGSGDLSMTGGVDYYVAKIHPGQVI